MSARCEAEATRSTLRLPSSGSGEASLHRGTVRSFCFAQSPRSQRRCAMSETDTRHRPQ